ncbi:MAG: hypothetical protein EBR33_13240, partial [Synechococcaceae bacterium WB4_1_0192]|nr:hypothetical protein [Synechococcaceae bacterium WB4_1_0192]
MLQLIAMVLIQTLNRSKRSGLACQRLRGRALLARLSPSRLKSNGTTGRSGLGLVLCLLHASS